MAGATAAGAPAEPQITPRRAIAFLALVFGMFMAILDIQIVSSSLSEIQAGISASSDEISWVQTSYLIAEVVMIPLSGFLARALSTRLLFALSAAGFTIASLLCATASSIGEMIFYRAVQGFIGGGMIPTAFAAAYTIFPKKYQAPVMSLVGLVVTLAPTIGPTVGGYLTSALSWHWLFLVNVPPGIVATLLCWFLVDFDEPEFDLLSRFDFTGLLGMAVFPRQPGICAGGRRAGRLVPVGHHRLLLGDDRDRRGALLLSGVPAEQPVVDLRAYKDRNFAWAPSSLSCWAWCSTASPISIRSSSRRCGDIIRSRRARRCSSQASPCSSSRPSWASSGASSTRGSSSHGLRLPHHLLLRADAHHEGLGLLRADVAAAPARRGADDVHGAHQCGGARHPAALAAQERQRPVQPDAQSRRCRGPRDHQYGAEQPLGPAHGPPARCGDLVAALCARHAQFHHRRLPGPPRLGCGTGGDEEDRPDAAPAALVMAFSDVFLGITIFLCAAAFLVFLVRKPRASAGSLRPTDTRLEGKPQASRVPVERVGPREGAKPPRSEDRRSTLSPSRLAS